MFFLSVEALASALVPVAVDHQADDDEEDATQHGEEHGEENSYSAHPFVALTRWRRGRQSVRQLEREGRVEENTS